MLETVTDRGSLKVSVPATRLNARWTAPEKALCPEVHSPKGGVNRSDLLLADLRQSFARFR
jgi:hypothetical protein